MRFPSRVIIRRTLHEVKVRHGKKKDVKNAVHQVEQTYSNDPVTRDGLKARLEAQQHAIDQQRKAAHC